MELHQVIEPSMTRECFSNKKKKELRIVKSEREPELCVLGERQKCIIRHVRVQGNGMVDGASVWLLQGSESVHFPFKRISQYLCSQLGMEWK